MSNLLILSGSHRKASNSGLIAELLKDLSQTDKIFTSVKIIDLGKNPLPMWNEDLFQDENWRQRWSDISISLKEADAFVLISPEWSGMATAAIKNFLLFCNPFEVGDKPCLPVGVSSARGGAYPISELRMSGYKNNRMSFIAEQLIFRDVQSILNGEKSEDNTYLLQRSVYALKVLAEYASAFRAVRSSGVLDYKSYPNGM